MARIAFIQNFWFQYLGIMYISSILKAENHSCEVFIEGGEKNLFNSVKKFKPDILGFYTTTGNQKWVLGTCGKLKEELKSKVVLGGPHPTFFSEIIEDERIDAICIGEGEFAMRDFCNRFDKNESLRNIQNLWVKENGNIYKNSLRLLIDDLDSLPPPDRSIYDKYPSLKDNLSVFTGRGCPFSCTFCYNKSYRELYKGKGKLIRRHSPKWIISELKRLKEKYDLKFVRFDDEVFVINPEWLDEFLPLYKKEINLPFTCLLHVKLTKPEIAKKLKMAGCKMAYFGIETGNESLRNQVLRKGFSNDEIIKAAKALKNEGIKIGTYNMLGIPGETIEKAFETVKINQLIKTDFPWCSLFQPYPKTEIEEYCRKNKYLKEGYSPDDMSASFFKKCVIENKEKKELENLQRFFHLAVRFPRLEKIIKFLIKLPPNIFFELIFYLTYSYRYLKTYRVSLYRILITGLRSKEYL